MKISPILLFLTISLWSSFSYSDAFLDDIAVKIDKHMESGQYLDASKFSEKAVSHAQMIFGERSGESAFFMNRLAMANLMDGNYKISELNNLKALKIYSEIFSEDNSLTLDAKNSLARTYDKQDKKDLAIPLFLEVLAISKEIDSNDIFISQLDRLHKWAIDLQKEDRLEFALLLYAGILPYMEEARGKVHLKTLGIMENQASIYQKQGKYNLSVARYSDILKVRKKVQGVKHLTTLTTMFSLGRVLSDNVEYTKAEDILLQAYKLHSESYGDKHFLTLSLMNDLAYVYSKQGKYELAEPFFIKSFSLRKALFGENNSATILSMANLANFYSEQGRHVVASPLYIEALRLSKELLGEKHPNTLAIMDSLSTNYISLSEFELGKKLLKQTINLKNEILGEGHFSTLGSMFNLAQLFDDFDLFDQAISQHKLTLKLRKGHLGENHPDTLDSYIALAKLYNLSGKYDLAEKMIIDVLAKRKNILGSLNPKTQYTNLALAHVFFNQGNYKKSSDLAEKIFNFDTKLLNNYLWGAGEETRKAYIQRSKGRDNFFLTVFSHEGVKKNPRHLLNFSLQRKGQLLQISSQIKAITRTSTKNNDISELANQLISDRKALADLIFANNNDISSIEVLEEKVNQQQAKLARKIQHLQHNSRLVLPEQVIQSLDKESVYVDFLIHQPYLMKKDQLLKNSILLALIVSNQQKTPIQLVSLGDMSVIEAHIKKLLMRMESDRSSIYEKEAVALYKKLWEPLEPYLKNINQVYIAPDGMLNILPFALLKKAPKEQFLIEKYQINMVSSGRDLVIPPMTDTNQNPPAIFAAPLYSPEQRASYEINSVHEKSITVAKRASGFKFLPLPSALKEGDIINNQLQSNRDSVEYYRLESATEQAVVNLKSPEILHFATHGFYKEDAVNENLTTSENPLLRSGLALVDANLAKQGKSKDGILTAEEILDLNLAGTDLVTLSACETGLGEIVVNEGVYGLKRAFQNAGAKAVLSTLWEVHSVSSKDFMIKFYEYFLKDKSAQKALRKAQLDFLKDKDEHTGYDFPKHPKHWAPFTVVGKH